MENTIEISCGHCGKAFQKMRKEYRRCINAGRSADQFFCTRSCGTAWKHRNLVGHTAQRASYLRPQHGNGFNRKGRFTHYLRKSRGRHKDGWDNTNLTEEYLTMLWDTQEGKCVWTGMEMVPIADGAVVDYFTSASLDRIDSSLGYVKGNVQFVLLPLNNAKGNQDDDDFRMFLNSLKESLRG